MSKLDAVKAITRKSARDFVQNNQDAVKSWQPCDPTGQIDCTYCQEVARLRVLDRCTCGVLLDGPDTKHDIKCDMEAPT